MKRFISGVIVGGVLAGTIALAASYVAEPASFKVMVNGKEFTSDPPAMVINGSTYLPLRAMGEALNVPVEWNAELNQAEVGSSAPVVQENEYSRANPAPINTMQTYVKNKKYSDSNYSAAIKVLEVTRGTEAYELLKSQYDGTEKAQEGYEYIVVKVAFSLLTSQDDKSVLATASEFDFYSENDEEYRDYSLVYMEKRLSQNLFVGGNAEGYLVQKVKRNDKTKLAYGLDYDGTGGIWFKLYE